MADADHRVRRAIRLDEGIERCSVGGMQPHAAMRGSSAEIFGLVGAVYGVPAHEEYRMGHGRAAIDGLGMVAKQCGRLEGACRRTIAGPGR